MTQPSAPRFSAWVPTVASDWPEIRAVTALVGGFHSPIEQECLAIALRRHLSTFSPSARRLTEERSVERNHFAAALAEEICFVHAEPGGHSESLRNLAVSWGKTLKILA